MFKRIAVALDDSDCSREAFAVALDLAKTEGSEIGLCSVVDPIVVSGSAAPSPEMDLVIRDMELAGQRLVRQGVEQAHAAGIVASGQARRGVPAFEILRYVTSFDADLIVMGTHGRRGLPHFLLGSVAEVVLRESSVPVLAVRTRPAASKRALHRDLT
ncbi:MAG: universal stress protein, partial [Candidatus Tumulicola sp.]